MTSHKALVLALWLLGSGCTVFVDRELDKAEERSRTRGDGDQSGEFDPNHDAAMSDGDAAWLAPEDAEQDAEADDILDGGATITDGGDEGGPSGLKVCVGVDHACALKPDGDLICWGANDKGQRNGLTGRYKEVACGDYHTCAIDLDGVMRCIGRNLDGQAPGRTDGPFLRVAAGNAHTCAINHLSYVKCWGAGAMGTGAMQATPNSAQFKELAAGEDVTCGIRVDNSQVSCWGTMSSGRKMPPAGVAFKSIDMGRAHGCGVTVGGTVECWGDVSFAVHTPIPKARQIAAGQLLTCALLENGTLQCWNDGEQLLPSGWDGKFELVVAGEGAICGLAEAGDLKCMGNDAIVGALPSSPL